jgi:hypothetical protein
LEVEQAQMNLDRVTITGADDSVRPTDLFDLSAKYPFVEWGILVSKSQMGNPRFPTDHWRRNLQQGATAREGVKLSLHLCGQWVSDILTGKYGAIPDSINIGFSRIQLNFHAEAQYWDALDCVGVLQALAPDEVIFQIDGNAGQFIFESVTACGHAFRCAPLFDLSHGAGVLPKEWPQPLESDMYHGYAGGLGPDNLAEQIPLIGAAASQRECPFWIDMETRVRSDNDRQFDLEKVERCLQIAAPFVSRERVTESLT